MYPPVDTRSPVEVEATVAEIYRRLYPGVDHVFVARAFFWTIDCFTGNYPGYQAIDARYHDFEHTLQGTLCMARLLEGRAKADAHPAIGRDLFELGLLAILFHDTGYLKRATDKTGTGAKYTLIHVSRSCEFAAQILREKGFGPAHVQAVQNMIRCTGVNVDLDSIPFQSEAERVIGFALGTSDLLGQMAADDYIDKLPILYAEFEEAARHNNGPGSGTGAFESQDDLMRKTPLFWEKYVVPKINKDFLGLYHFLSDPPPNGPNEYIDRIEANLDRLRDSLSAGTGVRSA